MRITKKIVINKPIDQVWNLIAHDFDKAHLWMGPVPHSYALGDGVTSNGAPMEGRICHLSDKPDGAQAKEIITDFDETAKSLTFEVTSINVPAIVPIKKNIVSMSLRQLGAGKTEVTWVSRPQLKLFAFPLYPLLRVGASAAFGSILRGLKDYAENTQLSAAKAV